MSNPKECSSDSKERVFALGYDEQKVFKMDGNLIKNSEVQLELVIAEWETDVSMMEESSQQWWCSRKCHHLLFLIFTVHTSMLLSFWLNCNFLWWGSLETLKKSRVEKMDNHYRYWHMELWKQKVSHCMACELKSQKSWQWSRRCRTGEPSEYVPV